MFETLDYTIRIGSTPAFLYFDLLKKQFGAWEFSKIWLQNPGNGISETLDSKITSTNVIYGETLLISKQIANFNMLYAKTFDYSSFRKPRKKTFSGFAKAWVANKFSFNLPSCKSLDIYVICGVLSSVEFSPKVQEMAFQRL